jgi:hypothetical protein
MVSATNGLCWGFHNIQYRPHGLSRLYDNGFFSEDPGFLIPCINHTPILEGKFLSKKCGLYMRKYGIVISYIFVKNIFLIIKMLIVLEINIFTLNNQY